MFDRIQNFRFTIFQQLSVTSAPHVSCFAFRYNIWMANKYWQYELGNNSGCDSTRSSGNNYWRLIPKTFFRRIIGGDTCICRCRGSGSNSSYCFYFCSGNKCFLQWCPRWTNCCFFWWCSSVYIPLEYRRNNRYSDGSCARNIYCYRYRQWQIVPRQIPSVIQNRHWLRNAGPWQNSLLAAGTTILSLTGWKIGTQLALLAWTTPDGHIVSANSTAATVDAELMFPRLQIRIMDESGEIPHMWH